MPFSSERCRDTSTLGEFSVDFWQTVSEFLFEYVPDNSRPILIASFVFQNMLRFNGYRI